MQRRDVLRSAAAAGIEITQSASSTGLGRGPPAFSETDFRGVLRAVPGLHLRPRWLREEAVDVYRRWDAPGGTPT